MDYSNFSEILLSLLTLIFLEVVLGVDNLVFISIASSRLPPHKQKAARKFGLFLALGTRLLLLASVVWLIGLTKPLFTLFSYSISGRDILLILGGGFLLTKATIEIHSEYEAVSTSDVKKRFANFYAVITQIAILDIIFSLDSILTAIGLTQTYWIMATAIIIAVILMMFASEPLSRFVSNHPTIKMLALSFLLLIGMVLIADGLKFHIPRGYIYFAICFSVFVEILNSIIHRKSKQRKPPLAE